MNKFSDSRIWLPLTTVLAFIAGIFCNSLLQSDSGRTEAEKKFSNLLNLIENEYVDKVDIDSLLEATIPSLLSNLDPHSVYISAADLQKVNEELEGSFSGVGVSFSLNNDTIFIIEAISGGPAEKVGIKAGDRILAVDGENVAGIGITEDGVFSRLRGEEGSEVKLTVKRHNSKKPLDFVVTRGEIPITSIDACYMLSPTIGYVKVNKFGRTTYDEFWESLYTLKDEGAEDFVIDLRGNLGGLLETAVLMANEFLPANTRIVETKGRHSNDNTIIYSDGMGNFQKSRVTVLLDEYSASSSEIFAGAIQDNDRGLIIGRRSFGKGLVQNQISLPDNSAVRLTVARYYTPSGRCIQKDYSDAAGYENDLLERFNHGEAFEADSMKVDLTREFTTLHGRKVYGGGGIIPDIFIPNDTIGITGYYVNTVNAGILQKYALQYVELNRDALEKAETVGELKKMLPSDDTLLSSFVSFAATNGIPARWYYINISRDLIVNQLKALIARDVLGVGAYYEITNSKDPSISSATEQLKSGKADFPIKE